MKIIYYHLLLLLSVAFFNLKAQNTTIGKIKYQLEGSTNSQSVVTMWFTKSNYIYQFGTEDIDKLLSQKKNNYEILEDSLKDVERIQKIREYLAKTPPQTWYGELGNNIIIHSWFNLYNGKTFCVQDSITYMNWELLNDTATINGILCQKALGKYNKMQYTAWFAPSIPVAVAPLQYRGLPGLLIKCTNNMKKTTFEMIELEWPAKDQTPFKPCSGSTYITAAQLTEIINKQNAMAMKILETFQKAEKEGKTLNIKDVKKE